jgi:hypothetical protein
MTEAGEDGNMSDKPAGIAAATEHLHAAMAALSVPRVTAGQAEEDRETARRMHQILPGLPAHGVQRTLAELVAWVADGGVIVDPAHVWACQYAGGVSADYDVSVLYGEWATATP